MVYHIINPYQYRSYPSFLSIVYKIDFTTVTFVFIKYIITIINKTPPIDDPNIIP